MRYWRASTGLAVILSSLSLSACGADESAPTTTESLAIAPAQTPTPSPTPSPTMNPTPTPTPTPTPSQPRVSAAAFVNPDNGNIPDRSAHPIAFPSAIGFGAQTVVRSPNAVVYKINTLDDSANPTDGKISYRECALALQVNTPYEIPAGRPRYCVFEVAGVIALESPVRITVPHIYIAGQTSPGGIEFRLGSQYDPVDSLIDTRNGGNHAIVRYIRARLGEHPNRKSDNGDPIRTSQTSYQIYDHVSAMFGTDESINISGCNNCTIQWSIIGPNICRDAGHSSALHCKTFFIKPSDNMTVAYNLSQHGEQRGINIAPGIVPERVGVRTQADIIGNFVYNFTQEGGLLSNQFGSVYANYIGNSFYEGNRWRDLNGNYLAAFHQRDTSGTNGFSVYARDNLSPYNSMQNDYRSPFGFFISTEPGDVCGLNSQGQKTCGSTGYGVIRNNGGLARAPGAPANWLEPWMLVDAQQAQRNVLDFAGADVCRDGTCRDNVDAMFIEDVRTCDVAPRLFSNGWTSSVAETGGFASIFATGNAWSDRDNDGMPDNWEIQYANTDENAWDANQDADGDGYTNIEEYLNTLALEDERYRKIYTAGKGALPAYNCGKPMRTNPFR